jgi:hypothetical protein
MVNQNQREPDCRLRKASRRDFLQTSACVTAAIVAGDGRASAQRAAPQVDTPAFRPMFNGKDLSGWVVAPGAEKTWSARDGLVICSGHPNTILRTDRHYENFVMHVDWMHLEPGGNSGLYVWTNAELNSRGLPKGVEIQILDLDWVRLNTREGQPPPSIAYVHGEFIPVNGTTFMPDNPRGVRSMALENRARGHGEWNTYTVVAIDGVIKLAVNGKFVNGISQTSQKKGYLGLQSEGAEIHFRNIRIMELSPGVTSPEQTAPDLP